jgi:hypothetical protein
MQANNTESLVSESIQLEFFQLIQQRIPTNLSLVDEVADLLNISNDSAYRRLRGETSLSFDEIKLLSLHFQISLDALIGSDSYSVNFQFKPLDEIEYSFLDYMHSVVIDLKEIEADENSEVLYIANDIPLFHLFHVPEIASFKGFVWQKTVLGYSKLRDQKFSISKVDSDDLDKVSRQLRDIYCRVPSTEIFHPGTIDTTLNQIEYYYEAQMFENVNDALALCDKLAGLMNHLEKQAEFATKFSGDSVPTQKRSNYQLYFNDVLYIDNAVLVKTKEHRTVYLINMTLNSVITRSPSFYNEFHKTVQNLLSKSTLISGTSEKLRSKIFRIYEEKIAQLKRKIAYSNK